MQAYLFNVHTYEILALLGPAICSLYIIVHFMTHVHIYICAYVHTTCQHTSFNSVGVVQKSNKENVKIKFSNKRNQMQNIKRTTQQSQSTELIGYSYDVMQRHTIRGEMSMGDMYEMSEPTSNDHMGHQTRFRISATNRLGHKT